jgi:hypothetical protein
MTTARATVRSTARRPPIHGVIPKKFQRRQVA